MASALRSCAAAAIMSAAMAAAAASELAASEPPPPPSPTFYLRLGALGGFPETNAQATGGGFFHSVAPGGVPLAAISNVAVRPVYTLGLELGYFVTPNFAIAFSTAVPPLEHYKAVGLVTPFPLGTNLLGSTRAGSAIFLLQYYFAQFGAVQPYLGAGVGYTLNFANINDGILTHFSLDQNFSFVLQAGADWMLTPNWGLFIDGKKQFLSTDAQGFVLNTTIPVRAHIQFDPWRAAAGITFRY